MEVKTDQQDMRSTLILMVEALNGINDKLETILDANMKLVKISEMLLQHTGKEKPSPDFTKEPDVMAILNLPLTLRKTILILYKLEKATADDLAKETKRLRAVESAAANELVRMGYIKKKREGREVFFYIENQLELKSNG